ncbi:MAG: HlyC/CorC family transporter [Elusimicrobiaceae bacterium]|nr:HlyC/CorC family transporter [Elusimicrobiaceae bacterium]
MITLLIILLMLAANALLAAYEMGLASISRTRLSLLVQNKCSGAEAALYMKDHMEGSLATVQIGITVAGSIAAAFGGSDAGARFAPWLREHLYLSRHAANALAMICVVFPLSFLTIVFAELTPKTFAIKNKEFVVLKLSPCMRVMYALLAPIVNIMEAIVRILTRKFSRVPDPKEMQKTAMEDLRTAAAIASSYRLFGKTEEKIVLSSAQFCVRKIREIQVPLEQVYMLNADDSIADTFVKAHLDMHTRFPVRADAQDPQSIIGYLNFKDIFLSTKIAQGGPTSARSIVRPILRLEADTIISAALEKLMKNKQHICLVTEDAKITGIVTLEDIFEEMVGEIEDEYDFFPAYIRPFGKALAASAPAKIADIFERLDLSVPADVTPATTVEQWVSQKLGHEPTKNEKIRQNGILLETRKFRRHKMMEVLISKAE